MQLALNRDKLIVVGISELAVSSDREATLITYSLGSCLGATVFDPITGTGGMIHSMLPLSSCDLVKAKLTPAMFVDTGVICLLQAVLNRGALRKDLIFKVAGCGSPLDTKGMFKIGERNNTVLRKILWKNNIVVKGELIGGVEPKTLHLDLSTGKTFVRVTGKGDFEI